MAPVVIPDDAYLLVEGDVPREHAPTVLIALILLMFGAVNLVGLVARALSVDVVDGAPHLRHPRQARRSRSSRCTPGRVGIYSCGITVYDLCHVGHARMMVAFDVIVRHLRASGLAVHFVRNVTDVDDKIIRKRARPRSGPPPRWRTNTPRR